MSAERIVFGLRFKCNIRIMKVECNLRLKDLSGRKDFLKTLKNA